MHVIHKYQLDFKLCLNKPELVRMPEGAHVLDAQIQHELITLWAMVDPKAEEEVRAFFVAGTGHDLPKWIRPGDYIATVQHGIFVWHVFEMPKEGGRVVK